jgi:hypothetical protein
VANIHSLVIALSICATSDYCLGLLRTVESRYRTAVEIDVLGIELVHRYHFLRSSQVRLGLRLHLLEAILRSYLLFLRKLVDICLINILILVKVIVIIILFLYCLPVLISLREDNTLLLLRLLKILNYWITMRPKSSSYRLVWPVFLGNWLTRFFESDTTLTWYSKISLLRIIIVLIFFIRLTTE